MPILWRELNSRYLEWGIAAFRQDPHINELILYTLFSHDKPVIDGRKNVSWQYILYRTTDENFFILLEHDYNRKLQRITYIDR